ncbi:MAG: hypothetical protein E6G38_09675 [Actinobacteria bacterium]|nr:MAG: hypothetical protein E6G38_09675 [Actinomycetota bacterium]
MDAGKVEERVAVEHGYMPESDPERNPGRDDADLGQLDATGSPPKSADPVARHVPKSERQRHGRDCAQDRERQPERAVHAERDRQGEEQRTE